jgi:hypothetical protein
MEIPSSTRRSIVLLIAHASRWPQQKLVSYLKLVVNFISLIRCQVIITPRNNPPLALAQNVSLNESFSVVVQLTHEDIDGDVVTYLINKLPENGGSLTQVDEKDNNLEEILKPGLLSNSRGRVRYSPPKDTCGMGLDVFTFNVSDKDYTSLAATITLNVYCLPGAHIVSDALFYVFFAIAILLAVVSIGFIVVVGVFKEKQVRKKKTMLRSF